MFKEDIEQLLIRARLEIVGFDYKNAKKDLELALYFDEENIDLLLAYAEINQKSNNIQTLDIYNKIERITNDDFVLSVVFNDRGLFYRNTAQYGKALTQLLKAEKIRYSLYKENKAKGNYVETLSNIANLYFIKGDIKNSIDYYNRAYGISNDLFNENSIKYYETHFNVLIEYASMKRNLGDIKSAKKNYDIISEEIEGKFDKLSSYKKALFFLKYGIFLKEIVNKSNSEFSFKKGIILLEDKTPGINNLYEENKFDITKYEFHIPLLLAILYQELAKVIDPRINYELKKVSYNRALFIYNLNMSDKTSFGIIHIGDYIGLQIEYGMFILPSKDDGLKKIASSFVNSAKNNAFGLKGENKKFLNWGRFYNLLTAYHAMDGNKDSLRYYSEKSYLHSLKLFNKSPQKYYYSLMGSTINVAQSYILTGVDNNETEKSIFKKLKFSRNKFKKFTKKGVSRDAQIIYLDRLIMYFKNGIEFGEPRDISLYLKFK